MIKNINRNTRRAQTSTEADSFRIRGVRIQSPESGRLPYSTDVLVQRFISGKNCE